MNYNWNWLVFWDEAPGGITYFQTLLEGLAWTIGTAALSWMIALGMGTLVGVARTTNITWARRLGTAYVELLRNVPLLVQMFLWYFVMPEVVPRSLGDTIKQIAPPWGIFIPAVLCLGLDRKSTRLNSSHVKISYDVFCLKKKIKHT